MIYDNCHLSYDNCHLSVLIIIQVVHFYCYIFILSPTYVHLNTYKRTRTHM